MGPALLAMVLAGLGQLAGWRGVDLPAQIYRVDSFHRSGLALWDFRWYGGHWTLDYSVLYPPLAATLGVVPVLLLSAGIAALAFDRLARAELGAGAETASYVFASGTLVQASIGQLTFLTGEAAGLAAVWAVRRRRFAAATLLALVCCLSSPLAGAFVALAMAAWLASRWRADGRVRLALGAGAVCLAAVGPVVAAAVVFPGAGPMPYPGLDWGWEFGVACVLGLLAGRQQPAIEIGAGLFCVAATVSVLVPSALGGNVGRIEDVLALPLATALLWERARLVLPFAALPLAFSQWGPAWGAFSAGPAAPSTHAAYFAPLDTELRSAGGPAGRVEVVPTEYHWEAAYVAPVMPLARGWERQVDVAYNPIFYRPGALTAPAYRAWLIRSGARFVALAEAPLDMAGREEGDLVASGAVPGLDLIWHSTDWRLYSVRGSPGIVSGPARLVSTSGSDMVVDARSAGSVLVRVRYTKGLTIRSGAGCLTRSGPDSVWVRVPRPETFTLGVTLLDGGSRSC